MAAAAAAGGSHHYHNHLLLLLSLPLQVIGSVIMIFVIIAFIVKVQYDSSYYRLF